MDSLLVNFSVSNDRSRIVKSRNKRYKALKPGDTVLIKAKLSVAEISGDHEFKLTVNPNLDQPENYMFNNIYTEDFYVEKDETDPVLDVTFNGRHIMDGGIVSPKPKLRVSAKDDNQYFLLNDTNHINVFLTHPNGMEKKLDYRDELKFYPAKNGKNNEATVMYEPEDNLANGTYQLKVQAEDESGNRSGQQLYKKEFEVINETTITNFYPYPNPFTSRMRFVFTLTGSQIPDKINIQIMTIRGKVIKEITKEELGPLNIGVNKTNFVWQGRDEFGDPVGNGVYFYKVQAYVNGEDIKHRETAGDKFFEKGIGKLYLMR